MSSPPIYRSTVRGGVARELVTDPLTTMSALAAMEEPVVAARAAGIRLWFVCDPELARELLGDRADELGRNKLLNRLFARVSGQNLFTAEGEAWRWRRRAISPAFGHEQLRLGIADAIRAVQRHVATWPLGSAFDIQDATMDLTLDAAASGLFGCELGAEQRARIRGDLATVLDWVQTRSTRPLGIPLVVPTPGNRRVRRARAHLHRTVAELLDARDEQAQPRLVDHISAAVDPSTGQAMDRRSAIAEALVMLIAGHETTAAAAAWMLHQLSTDHDLQQRCRDEVVERCGDSELSVEVLHQLPLVRAVVAETLRLHPPAWGIPRMSTRPAPIGPYRARRLEPIIVAPAAIHRRESLFPGADRFDPDRHAGDDSGSALIPFGLGPRRCIGSNFANAELTALAAAAVSAHRLESHGTATVDPAFALRLAGASLTVRTREPQD